MSTKSKKTEQTYHKTEIKGEKIFQHYIARCLVDSQGYIERNPKINYDVAPALDTGLLFQFIKKTQPDEWQTFTEQYKAQSETEFLKRLEKALRESPAHTVLREGIKFVPNIEFTLCYFKPASNLNPDLTRLYEGNILSVMQEVEYSSKNGKRIDIVTFVNGIPIATMEVKNLLTKSTFRDAEEQYRKDRPPAGEPLLTFKRGALIHFAVDQDNVSMTTRLKNGDTSFLPFNRGHKKGAGNPDVDGDENRVAYLYKDLSEGNAVFSREVLLDLIGRFIHLERKNGSETLIFPRFQQLDAVRQILGDVKKHGIGRNYLIQHSAGSGKSNTIAWITHQIINLHDENEKPIVDSAIVVTDRLVLDRQLQETIGNFAQTKGVVEKIDGTSRQLKEAIEGGARIIVTTIQKFSTKNLALLFGQSKKKFAVIIDEAHSSQSGKASEAMTGALTRESKILDSIEEVILEEQQARGPQNNISYLAFTATPRTVTLERFGIEGSDRKPHPFHLYSMRQAIEEGFILDVLQNYTTYDTYYKLEKAIEEDPKFRTRPARRRIARFATLHPTALDQKVEVIVEHFRRHAQHELSGQAKAMVVTQSREHAVRYWKHINQYIKNKRYNGVRALVAFSDTIKIDGQEYTEAKANGFSETQLTKKFDSDEFQILVVAEKYQTGFDQPKLVAMYVDKNLSELQAVQTLSRLNRKYPDKDNTFILDFYNTTDGIKESFQPYFEATELTERTDINQIYDLESRIMGAAFIADKEIEQFAQNFFAKNEMTQHDRLKLEGIVRLAVERFKIEEDETHKEEFRQLLKSYIRFYIFVSQVVTLNDTSLEKLYVYASWLSRLLPSRIIPGEISVTDDMLKLSAFRIDKKEEGSASLQAGETEKIGPITEFGANPYTDDEKKSLSEIIKAFNERHGTNFTKEDFLRFEIINDKILDETMFEMIRKNPTDVVYKAFEEAFFKGMIRTFQKDNEMRSVVMTDRDAREKVTRHFFRRAQRIVLENEKNNP